MYFPQIISNNIPIIFHKGSWEQSCSWWLKAAFVNYAHSRSNEWMMMGQDPCGNELDSPGSIPLPVAMQ